MSFKNSYSITTLMIILYTYVTLRGCYRLNYNSFILRMTQRIIYVEGPFNFLDGTTGDSDQL